MPPQKRNKISIVKEGAGYFMPDIGPSTFLYWPGFKRFLLFGERQYSRMYFAVKKGSSCVEFGVNTKVYGPDQEALKKANANLLATQIGKDNKQGTPWYTVLILILLLLNLFLQMRSSGVIR